MATQMSSARRGIATDEMKQVAKDEDVTLDWLLPKIATGSIIIPSNNVRPQKDSQCGNWERHENQGECQHWHFNIKRQR